MPTTATASRDRTWELRTREAKLNSTKSSRRLAFLYATVVFLSAFLLFQVQPLIAKCILPWFGGTPAVWTTCMLVFQFLLFGGYAYAHFSSTLLPPRGQAWLHAGLLVAALITLPIAPHDSWKPSGHESPALRIVLLLSISIGLPYFVLSATSPLFPRWFSRTHVGETPYRLYALSNVGSLLALLSYPFAVEPLLATNAQSAVWSVLFALFVVLCGATGWWMVRHSVAEHASDNPSIQRASASVPPAWSDFGLWFGLSMTASTLLLATTNQVCLDVAVVPFLWVLPLALYLLTFILCFDSDRWYSRRVYLPATAVLIVASVALINSGAWAPIVLQIAVFFGMMFGCCMVCHGELAAQKPHPRFLTAYFLTMSAGGAAGGLFVGVLAPLLFVSYNELYFGIFSFIILVWLIRLVEDGARWPLPRWCAVPAVLALLVTLIGFLTQIGRHAPGAVAVARNFYGVLKVEEVQSTQTGEPMRQLCHGRITHGTQFIAPEKRHTPTAYYAKGTGVGQVMRHFKSSQPRRIGIVGLGIGTLAAYGRTFDSFRMYEINPKVIEFAEQRFSFLEDCPAEQIVITGDARLSLEFEPPQEFDVLVLDAFSGDAIPVHLLTQEALDVYLSHLNSDGILACHITNLHFNLKPVLAGLAKRAGLAVQFCHTPPDEQTAALAATWALLARQPSSLADLLNTNSRSTNIGKPVFWTDGRSNLLEVLW